MKKIKILGQRLVDALFPPACPVCGQALSFTDGRRDTVCQPCRGKLTYIKEPRCLKCGKEIQQEESEFCHDCEEKERSRYPHLFKQGIAVYAYTDAIQQSIYRFKYQNKREYAAFYAKEIAEQCGRQIRLWKPEVIIPVPLHDSKFRKRGYNQAALIAQKLSPLLNIFTDDTLLVRSRKTIPMKELNNQERRNNLENAFNCVRNSVKYKKVLIVDDIYTTGATIDTCSKVLLEAGAEEVFFVCLCIGRGF